MYVEYEVIAAGTRAGMVIRRPDPLQPGKLYPLIIFLHGIGERGSGTDLALDKLRTNGSVYQLEQAGAYHEFIIIEPQADADWEKGEVDEAYDYAREKHFENINWKKVYLTGLSLGGGGCQRYLAYNPAADEKFAACAPMCAGPNQYFIKNGDTGYQNIASTKMSLWFHHCADDTTVTPAQSTNLTMSKIKTINPNVKAVATIKNTGGHTGGWYPYGRYKAGVVDTSPSEASGFDDPACNLFEWFLMNEIGNTVLPPKVGATPVPVPEPEPIPTPIPEPVPTPTPTPTTDIYIKDVNYALRGGFFTIQWDNGPQTVKAKSGDSIINVYDRVVNGRRVLTVDYAVAPNDTFGPKKK